MRQDKTAARSPLVGKLELLVLSLVDASAQVALETLDQTQKVLDQDDLLARRLVEIKHKSDKFADASRQTLKQQALELCRDGGEVGTELVRQVGTVLRSALDEAREIGASCESLLKDLLEPALDLPNPFRQKTKASARSKEPTIIPISIQDN